MNTFLCFENSYKASWFQIYQKIQNLSERFWVMNNLSIFGLKKNYLHRIFEIINLKQIKILLTISFDVLMTFQNLPLWLKSEFRSKRYLIIYHLNFWICFWFFWIFLNFFESIFFLIFEYGCTLELKMINIDVIDNKWC